MLPPFFFGAFSQPAVQTFGNPQLELPGISVWGCWFCNLHSAFQCSCQPFLFRIFCIFCSLFHGTPNGDTSGQIRITGHVSSLIRIRENFQPIGKIHIVFNRFYFQIPPPPPVVPCFRTKKAACADTQTAFVSLTEQPWQFPPVWRKQRHRSQPCRPGLSGPAQRRLWSGRR